MPKQREVTAKIQGGGSWKCVLVIGARQVTYLHLSCQFHLGIFESAPHVINFMS